MSRVRFKERATPTNPPADHQEFYLGTDGNFKAIDELGTIVDFNSSFSYTDEKAQDAVGGILVDSSNIDLTYNDGAPSITADLINTAVTPGSYGIAGSVPQITVDAKGRVTAAANVAISITQSQVSDLTANETVDHSTVQIATASSTSGLSGGGDLTATRNLVVDINGTTALTSRVSADDKFLIWDDSASARRRVSRADLVACSPDRFYSFQTDFIESVTGSGHFTATITGTGASNQVGTYGIDVSENAMGVSQLDTGTTSTGRAYLATSSLTQIFAGHSALFFACRMAPEALSTGSETFILRAGFLDSSGGAGDGTDGVFFRYTDAVNGGRWEAQVFAAGVLQASADTGVSATTSYLVFEIDLSEDGNTAVFYIDGAQVASLDSSSLAPANFFGYGMGIEKTVGATQRNLSIDWACFEIKRSTSR